VQRLTRFVKHVLATLVRPGLPEAAFDTTLHDALRMCTRRVSCGNRSCRARQGGSMQWAACTVRAGV